MRSLSSLPFFALATAPDAEITDVGGLKGKRIALADLNTCDHLLVRYLLEKNGVDDVDAGSAPLGPNLVDGPRKALLRANGWIRANSGAEIVQNVPEDPVSGDDRATPAARLDAVRAGLHPAATTLDRAAVQRVIDVQKSRRGWSSWTARPSAASAARCVGELLEPIMLLLNSVLNQAQSSSDAALMMATVLIIMLIFALVGRLEAYPMRWRQAR